MTSDGIARGYLKRARIRRSALDTLLKGGGFADVVREAHEVAELVLKGALRYAGIDPPKRHDVKHVVLRTLARFPPEWRQELAKLTEASSRLAEDRARAFYGDEEQLKDASELFGPEDAQRAIALVDRLLAFYSSLLGEA